MKDKILALESLRGIAACIVVYGHFFTINLPINYPPHYSFLNRIFSNGSIAVYLFFILSGFVLTYKIFLSYSHTKIAIASIKRFFRLFLIIFLTSLIALFLAKNKLLFGFFDGSYKPINLTFWQCLTESIYVFFDGKHFNGVFWTIKYEYMGSLLLFFTILCSWSIASLSLYNFLQNSQGGG